MKGAMSDESMNSQDEVLNRVLIFLGIFLSLEFALQVFIFASSESSLKYIIANGLLYVLLVVTIIVRKRLDSSTKIFILTFVSVGISVIGLLYNALNGINYAIVALMIILAFLVPRKFLYIITTFVLLLYSFIAYSFITGLIHPVNDLNQLNKSPFHWLMTLGSIFSLTLILIFTFRDFYNELVNSISNRKYAEIKYRKLFEASNDGIIFLKDDIIFDCNPKACEQFLISKQEFIGKSIADFSPKTQYNGDSSIWAAQKVIGLTISGKPQEFDWVHQRSNRETFDCVVYLSKIELHDGVYVQGVVRDVTEKKKSERSLLELQNNLQLLVKQRTEDLEKTTHKWKAVSEELTVKNEVVALQNVELNTALEKLKDVQTQLFQADRMASLGVLTAGVSHEINNPLQYLSGVYSGFQNYFDKYGSSEEDTTSYLLTSTETAIERISTIVKGLNQFSRNNESLEEDCHLKNIVDNCLALLYNQYKDSIRVTKCYTEEDVVIKGNIGELHQVFANLLSNAIHAIHAIAETGTIKIKLARVQDDVHVEIVDSGCGICEKNLNRITEPFFTTKIPGKGTGLGLSISYSILKNHRGSLDFESKLNKGTKSKIILPLKL